MVVRNLESAANPGPPLSVRKFVIVTRCPDSLARSLCAYLSSRNNDIAGYWGIGMLCAASKREGKPKFSFTIYPGQVIKGITRRWSDPTLHWADPAERSSWVESWWSRRAGQ